MNGAGTSPRPPIFGDQPLRIAVVGYGYWGPNLVRNLRELGDAELAAVCDLRPDALAAVERRYPGVFATTDLDEVLADETIDGVVVATPVSTHREIAEAALLAGKHAFVEKPLADSSADAMALVRLAEQRGLVLMPGHTFLYSPPVNKVRELIQAGSWERSTSSRRAA